MSGTPDKSPFNPFVAAGTVILGILCFAAFVVVFALAHGRDRHDGAAHAHSRSAVGFAAVEELLQNTGITTVISRGALSQDTPKAGLLVLTPPPDRAIPEGLTQSMPTHATLLVLPKWRTTTMDEHPGWVRQDGLIAADSILKLLPSAFRHAVLVRRNRVATPNLSAATAFDAVFTIASVDRLQSLRMPDHSTIEPLLRDADNGIVLGRTGTFYVLTDPDLLNNQAMRTEAGAAGAIELLTQLAAGGTVVFDVSLNGYGRVHDPLRAMFVPPLLGATLCAAAAAVAFGLLSAVRFGPVQRPTSSFGLGKTALAANSAALFLRAGRDARLAVPYATLIRAAAIQALRLPRALGASQANAELDRLGQQRNPGGEAWPTLLRASDEVRSRTDLLAVAQRLDAWKKGLSFAHR